MSRYKAFPPGRGHLQVPVSSRRAALAGLTLYAPCRPKALMVRDVGWSLVSRLGPWALPGRRRPVAPPLEPEKWLAFLDHASRHIIPFDEVALYRRTQGDRTGFMTLLINEGAPSAFLKVRPAERRELERERTAVESVVRYRPKSFEVPRVVGATAFEGWSILAFAALDAVAHRPARRPPIPEIAAEISEALLSISKPDDTPAHWLPSHGDLTPWNLREWGPGRLTLVDWEGAEWAPPGADQVLYHAAATAVLGPSEGPAADAPEARGFWRERLALRTGAGRDERLARQMIAALDAPLSRRNAESSAKI